MTDIIDYHVDSLEIKIFDTIENDQTQQQQRPEQQPEQRTNYSSNHYLDIISLINLLSSPSDIDYQIISDFFLTYRSFISQHTLLKILFLKLKWSLTQIDDNSHEHKQNIGKLSLIRTFVVIRHWLLNYFADDFIPFIELRQQFIQVINSIHHNDLFVQRISTTLKKHWTYCCNKSWDEDVNPEDYNTFQLKVGPQHVSSRSKRLSTIALNQQRDPMTRNSIVLSTFDKTALHKLPIPIPNKSEKSAPKAFLNPKNSNLRLSKAILTTSINNELYVPLSSPTSSLHNTIRGGADFPKDSKPTKFIPPTPVKKMEVQVQLPPTSKPQPRGLKPLIENWLKTFNLHNSKAKSKDNQHVEKFMRSVVSVAKPDNEALLKLTADKFDILSARTIDELEYLVKFHNELLNKHGPKTQLDNNNSFSFTIDDPSKDNLGAPNIDNMNICECISNINKSVLSFQHKFSGNDDNKSYISYDSDISKGKSGGNEDVDGLIKKKNKVGNLREFNFENDHMGQENEESSRPVSVISQSTIPVPPSDIDPSVEQTKEATGDISEDQVNEKVNSDEANNLDIDPEIKPQAQDQSDESRNAEGDVEEEILDPEAQKESPNSNQQSIIEQQDGETNEAFPESQGDEEPKCIKAEDVNEHRPTSLTSLNSDSDYDEIESFVSTYEEIEEIEEIEENEELDITGPNASEQNEPATPPSTDGIISSTPHASPIKSIDEAGIETSTPTKHRSVVFATTDKLDLNRVPTFTKVNSKTDDEKHHSYLSKRSNKSYISYDSTRSKPQISDMSTNSIFSNVKRNQLVMVHEDHNGAEDASTSGAQEDLKKTKEKLMQQDEASIRLVESGDFAVPYPGVDGEAIAELAAISDDSFQSDPINAALLKLEGTYSLNKKSYNSSIDSKELQRQVQDLDIKSVRNSKFIDQRRKTKLFSLTPVKQKPISIQSSSKILLELLINHKINNDILAIGNGSNHISFILNFDSKTLAQQFTLIEKDCLLEIDWKELIELRWEFNNILSINSWLELLIQNENIQGIDLCISRFNLTVNWIISEILLTKDITLRKLTIQRFIHIAQNCYMLQNYSTLMEILLALGSDKILKLKDTWRIIEPGDILIYKNLEKISSPFKNFSNLRNELNSLKPSKGCVPFLGLYLSDLIFNKEKNSTRDQMVNFNKFRTDSKIVKSLIQCIQWSTLYRLDLVDEVLSKCLYIKALDEDEMNECLKDIQAGTV